MRVFANRASQHRPSPRRAARRAIRRGDVAAARSLADMGVPGLQALVDAFRGRNRRATALLLHEALDRLPGDRSRSLASLKIRDAVFVRLLRDRHAIVRSVSVRIGGYSGQCRWVPLIARVLDEDTDGFVRCRAADALGHLEAADAMAILARVAEDRLDPARYHAVRALGRLGPAACGHLVRLCVDHAEEVLRRIAAETIAHFADMAAWEALLAALAGATSCEVRKTLVEGLGRSRTGRATAPLIDRLAHDSSPIVREAAAEALATLGDTTSVGALLDSALHDPFAEPGETAIDPRASAPWRYPVREAAVEALVVLGGVETCGEARSVP